MSAGPGKCTRQKDRRLAAIEIEPTRIYEIEDARQFLAGLYELRGTRRLTNPVLKAVLGNWNVSATITFASGAPAGVGFTLQSGADIIGR